MKTGRKLRLIGLRMLAVAILFVFCAVSNPALGRTIQIGSFVFGAKQKRIGYAVYAAVMGLLFVLSFLARERK